MQVLDSIVQEQIQHIRNYKILERAGSGAFGIVYKIQNEDGDILALKVLAIPQEEKVKVLDAVERLHVEGILEREKAAMEFHHAHIIHISESFKINIDGITVPCVVQEYVSGDTLEKVLQRGSLSRKQQESLALGITSAVGYLHQKAWVHRDIKPANIIDEILMDFSIAERIDAQKRIVNPVPAEQSSKYAAPETSQQNYDACRADVWSLGLLLASIFANTSCVNQSNLAETLKKVPRRYQAVLKTCLESDPQKRYADGNEVYRALKKAQWHYTRKTVKCFLPFIAVGVAIFGYVSFEILKEKRSMLYLNTCRSYVDEEHDADHAEPFCEKAVWWNSESSLAYLYLGHSLLEQGKYQEARDAYLRANKNGNHGDPKDNNPIISAELERKSLELRISNKPQEANFLLEVIKEF